MSILESDGIAFEWEDGVLQAIGSKGDRYDIDVNTKACSCPAFKYSKATPQFCKHSLAAANLHLPAPETEGLTLED